MAYSMEFLQNIPTKWLGVVGVFPSAKILAAILVKESYDRLNGSMSFLKLFM